MDNKKFEKLMYALTKYAAKDSFEDWLEWRGLTFDDYMEIQRYLENEYKITLYF
nr:hypothetical protein [Paenibacillus xylanexedens]